MKRAVDKSGVVHFKSVDGRLLCCSEPVNLFGEVDTLVETSSPVTCPACAIRYCESKNAPWKEVETKVLEQACYDAVKEPKC